MGKNQYAKALRYAQEKVAAERAEIRAQIDMDAACMAANDVFQMGPSRARAFCEAMMRYTMEIGTMFIEDSKSDVTLEYSKTTLDRRIKSIVGEDNFQPWEVRYGSRVMR